MLLVFVIQIKLFLKNCSISKAYTIIIQKSHINTKEDHWGVSTKIVSCINLRQDYIFEVKDHGAEN